jgi:Peptidase A4 family
VSRWFAGLGLALLLPWPELMGAPAVFHQSRIAGAIGEGWTSSNWSGYAVDGALVSQVSGEWTVPAVEPSASATYSAMWVGIGGTSDSSVIQVGTEQDYAGGGRYYSWYEALPAAEIRLDSLAVQPGDRMRGEISANGKGAWAISLLNRTSGRSFAATVSYAGVQDSADWILEAPTVAGRIPSELAAYGQTAFAGIQANWRGPGLTPAQGGTLIQHEKAVSTPSHPNPAKDAFSLRHGADRPPPPVAS